VFGVIKRRNIIIMFLSIELMLNAVNISLVSFSHYLQDLRGQVFVFFIVTVAAAEAAIGLAIIIALFRNKATSHVDEMNEMKG
jgi:NADH-quinone oxidoreductase subunit K